MQGGQRLILLNCKNISKQSKQSKQTIKLKIAKQKPNFLLSNLSIIITEEIL